MCIGVYSDNHFCIHHANICATHSHSHPHPYRHTHKQGFHFQSIWLPCCRKVCCHSVKYVTKWNWWLTNLPLKRQNVLEEVLKIFCFWWKVLISILTQHIAKSKILRWRLFVRNKNFRDIFRSIYLYQIEQGETNNWILDVCLSIQLSVPAINYNIGYIVLSFIDSKRKRAMK